jgi:outer membrane protein TolC
MEKRDPPLDWSRITVLDLKTAQRFAMADNPTIQATEIRIEQAKERISQARSAYWPHLDANASVSRIWMPENDYQDNLSTARMFDPGATIDDPQDYYRAGLTSTWLLFDGFERRYRSRQAQNAKYQMISARDDARRLLLTSVAISFLSAELASLEKASPEEMKVPDTEQMIAYALEHRPEILQSQLAIQNASLEKKMATSKYAPAINLTASVSGEREADTRFEGDDFGNTIGLNMTFNLFSGGLHRAQSREAMQKEIEARKLLEALKINITAEIRTTVEDVITFQTQLRLQQSNTRLVQENRDLVEKEYKAGQVSLVRLNESQRELTSAQTRTALALVALRQSWFALMSDTGMIAELE